MTQSELAEKAGISITTLNEIESKQHRDIRLSTLSSVCQVLKVSLIELFIETDLKVSRSDREQLLQASQIMEKLSKKLSDK